MQFLLFLRQVGESWLGGISWLHNLFLDTLFHSNVEEISNTFVSNL